MSAVQTLPWYQVWDRISDEPLSLALTLWSTEVRCGRHTYGDWRIPNGTGPLGRKGNRLREAAE